MTMMTPVKPRQGSMMLENRSDVASSIERKSVFSNHQGEGLPVLNRFKNAMSKQAGG